MPHKDPQARLEYMRRYNEKNREKIREYSRNYYYSHRNDPVYKKRCRTSRQKWVKGHPEVVKAQRRRYYERHKEEMLARRLDYEHRIKRLWRNGNGGLTDIKEKRRLGKEAEMLALKILPELGFRNILYLGGQRFIDFLATRDSLKCGIEVTINPYKYMGHVNSQLKMLEFLGLKCYVLFVTPDIRKYILKENPNYAHTRIYLRDFQNLREVN